MADKVMTYRTTVKEIADTIVRHQRRRAAVLWLPAAAGPVIVPPAGPAHAEPDGDAGPVPPLRVESRKAAADFPAKTPGTPRARSRTRSGAA